MVINRTSYDGLTGLFEYLMGHYMPGRELKLTVCHNAAMLNHFGTRDIELKAMLYQSEVKDWYVLVIAEGLSRPEMVACHEFAHLMQMVRGDLLFSPEKRIFTWKGRTYPASMAYDTRPWEVEAFRMEDKYRKEYIRFNK